MNIKKLRLEHPDRHIGSTAFAAMVAITIMFAARAATASPLAVLAPDVLVVHISRDVLLVNPQSGKARSLGKADAIAVDPKRHQLLMADTKKCLTTSIRVLKWRPHRRMAMVYRGSLPMVLQEVVPAPWGPYRYCVIGPVARERDGKIRTLPVWVAQLIGEDHHQIIDAPVPGLSGTMTMIALRSVRFSPTEPGTFAASGWLSKAVTVVNPGLVREKQGILGSQFILVAKGTIKHAWAVSGGVLTTQVFAYSKDGQYLLASVDLLAGRRYLRINTKTGTVKDIHFLPRFSTILASSDTLTQAIVLHWRSAEAMYNGWGGAPHLSGAAIPPNGWAPASAFTPLPKLAVTAGIRVKGLADRNRAVSLRRTTSTHEGTKTAGTDTQWDVWLVSKHHKPRKIVTLRGDIDPPGPPEVAAVFVGQEAFVSDGQFIWWVSVADPKEAVKKVKIRVKRGKRKEKDKNKDHHNN